jgi:hypothetical protein
MTAIWIAALIVVFALILPTLSEEARGAKLAYEGVSGDDVCDQCEESLIAIDHYADCLTGCVECNRWSWRGSKRGLLKLSAKDLRALQELKARSSDGLHPAWEERGCQQLLDIAPRTLH